MSSDPHWSLTREASCLCRDSLGVMEPRDGLSPLVLSEKAHLSTHHFLEKGSSVCAEPDPHRCGLGADLGSAGGKCILSWGLWEGIFSSLQGPGFRGVPPGSHF